MKTRQIKIYVGKNDKLSTELQLMLFRHGYRWARGWHRDHPGLPFISNNWNILGVGYGQHEQSLQWQDDDSCFDYDASTEFGKIIEWLEESGKENEVEQLQKTIKRLEEEKQQLTDDLRQAEEVAKQRADEIAKSTYASQSNPPFPEGYEWHNPHNLRPEQVEVSKGWRLLLKSEIKERGATYEIQGWDNPGWCAVYPFSGSAKRLTYRTKWPLPNTAFQACEAGSKAHNKEVIPTPQDDFPGSTGVVLDERKAIGVEYYVGILRSCKEVRTTCRDLTSEYRQLLFKYGHSDHNIGSLVAIDGKVCVRPNGNKEPFEVRVISVIH